MIKKVVCDEKGDLVIDISGEEALKTRADMSMEGIDKGTGEAIGLKTFEGNRGGLGSMKGGEEERTLKTDKKRVGWSEPNRSLEVYHICPICGTKYKGRTNKLYCCDKCKNVAKQRRFRKRKRDVRDFKPYRGKTGEVYYMINVDEKEVINFVPAFNADSRKRAKEYLDGAYPKDNVDNIMEQVKEVIRK